MNQTDKKKFAEIMYDVADNFGGQISTEGLKMRFDALVELTIEQVASAATYLVKHRKLTYPPIPTVKEFLDAAKGPELSLRSKSEIEVDKVLAKLEYHGRNGIADFDDPITQGLMTTRWPYQGWACNILEKDKVWWRKEFIVVYQAYSERQGAEQMLLIDPRKESQQNLTKLAATVLKRIDYDPDKKLETNFGV